jgi:type I restriction enzyme S subunit
VQEQIVVEVRRQLSIINALSVEIMTAIKRSVRLRSSVLVAAFSGELVSQDATDEPASLLLDRVATERFSFSNGRPSRNRTRRAKGTA